MGIPVEYDIPEDKQVKSTLELVLAEYIRADIDGLDSEIALDTSIYGHSF